MVLAALAALCLGFWGFALYQPAAPAVDHLYRAIQLFVLESGDAYGDVPWQLQVARLAAPALTVASVVLGLALLSRDRVDTWRARRRQGHVVVCGLGRRGATAALALRRAGHQVVGLEIDPTSSGIARWRQAGIPVVVGDAREPAVLARAAVPTADHLILLTSALELGGTVAFAAIGLPRNRGQRPLVIHLEIDQPDLAILIRALTMTEHQTPAWRLEELDLAGLGACAMLDDLAPWGPAVDAARVVVVGGSPLGIALVTQVARRWARAGGTDGGLTVTLVDPDGIADRLLPARRFGTTIRIATGLDGATGVAAPGLEASLAETPVTAAYVCVQDEAASLAASLEILHTWPGTPVLVRLEHATALAAVLSRDTPALQVIALDQRILTPTVLLDSTVEQIARALHEGYRRNAPEGDQSAVPWDRLPEQLRSSNRAQAADVARKIRSTGRVLVPDDGAPPDSFTEAEVRRLGELEHERWVQERQADGWVLGERDPVAKTSPYLVPWEVLEEEVREIDQRFIRELPDVLADAGLLLRRVATAEPRS